jgi:NAD(P)-dependent dehydrogenase (short-subunit alcohol dehydrogenase family)
MNRCDGKIVLVTGAQRGIGRAIAIRFAEAGADVALNFVDDKAAAESAAAEIVALGRRAATIAADIAKPEEARRLVAETCVLDCSDSRGVVQCLIDILELFGQREQFFALAKRPEKIQPARLNMQP